MVRWTEQWLAAIDFGVLAFQVLYFMIAVARHHTSYLNQPNGYELRMIRGYKSSFDESPRLLGAAALILLVYQAALLLEESIQVSPGARKDLPEIDWRSFQYLRANVISHTEDLADQERQPLARLQAK
jgi:hypothetical protein